MVKTILAGALAWSWFAIAQTAPPSQFAIKSFTVANGQATLTVHADGSDVALTGTMTQAPQLKWGNGRLIANCAGIGDLALECELGYDGGNAQLAVLKKINPTAYRLAISNMIAIDGDEHFATLIDLQNSRGLSPAATLNDLLRASAKANSIDQLIAALQAEPLATTATPSGARVPPSSAPPYGPPPPSFGGQPPVFAPPPLAFVPPAGSHGVHSRHEEHHTSDTIIDTYDDEVSVPVIQESSTVVNCLNGICAGGPVPPCFRCGSPVSPVPPIGVIPPPGTAVPPIGSLPPGAFPPGGVDPCSYGPCNTPPIAVGPPLPPSASAYPFMPYYPAYPTGGPVVVSSFYRGLPGGGAAFPPIYPPGR